MPQAMLRLENLCYILYRCLDMNLGHSHVPHVIIAKSYSISQDRVEKLHISSKLQHLG